MSGLESGPPDLPSEAQVREEEQGRRRTRRRPRLARSERNALLAAAVGGVSTALVNGLIALVVEAVRAALG
ncbi:hypothetical protein GCM10010521_69300 [Streptomyces rameus]|uniref:Uncharacterized protein n=1 Tax=Streptomyces rameus TaxID=68261 RepID=A0ABN3VA12_9ACTN